MLKARVLAHRDLEDSDTFLQALVKKYSADKDLEFNLEALAFMSREGDKTQFVPLLKKTLPLIEVEDDFQDLLSICADYCHYEDKEDVEKQIQKMLENRSHNSPESGIKDNDPDLTALGNVDGQMIMDTMDEMDFMDEMDNGRNGQRDTSPSRP